MKSLFAAITALLFLSILTSNSQAQLLLDIDPCAASYVDSMGNVKYRAIVFELKEDTVIAGFSGAKKHCIAMPAIVGEAKNHNSVSAETYFGDEAYQRKDSLSLAYPIANGTVKDWKAWRKLLSHIFEHELKINPEMHEFLWTESS